VLVEWERALCLEAVPCRMCGEAQRVYSLESHLTACTAHPANRAAEQLVEKFRSSAGSAADVVIATVSDHQAKLNALRVLSKACEEYSGNLGWSGEGGGYSERSSEEPWAAAIREAERAVSPTRAAGSVEDAHAAEVLTQLAAEVQRLGSALERLLASSRRFGAALGDGPDIEKDYVDEAADKTWEKARKAAIAALEAYERDNTLARLGAGIHA
jgi:hypothetical protein